MTYNTLKQKLNTLQKTFPQIKCAGFEESLQFEHFKIVFELKDAPNYTILQGKNDLTYNTTTDMWYLAYAQNQQLVVLDIADEETICEEFLQLMVLWFQGAQNICTQNK